MALLWLLLYFVIGVLVSAVAAKLDDWDPKINSDRHSANLAVIFWPLLLFFGIAMLFDKFAVLVFWLKDNMMVKKS